MHQKISTLIDADSSYHRSFDHQSSCKIISRTLTITANVIDNRISSCDLNEGWFLVVMSDGVPRDVSKTLIEWDQGSSYQVFGD